ncbi:MAG: hypothetical protein GY838_00935 [bacterium]|nr:hypothetical protein [bacterium]
MKTTLTITILATLLFTGAAEAQFLNRIGVYSSPAPVYPSAHPGNGETNVHFPDPGFLDLYLVCVNPYNTTADRPIQALGGYELNLVLDLTWLLHSVTIPDGVLDLDAADEALYCSGLVPVTAQGDNEIALLATIRLLHFEPQPGIGLVYLAPYWLTPSIPDHMAVTDAYDGFSLHQADPSSWGYDVPVCYINYFWDAPEDKSWGDVKALYR